MKPKYTLRPSARIAEHVFMAAEKAAAEYSVLPEIILKSWNIHQLLAVLEGIDRRHADEYAAQIQIVQAGSQGTTKSIRQTINNLKSFAAGKPLGGRK